MGKGEKWVKERDKVEQLRAVDMISWLAIAGEANTRICLCLLTRPDASRRALSSTTPLPPTTIFCTPRPHHAPKNVYRRN